MTTPIPLALERHYTVPEIADLWKLDRKVVRRLFQKQPDVIVVGNEETLYGKRRIHLRVPESVMLRVHREIRCVN